MIPLLGVFDARKEQAWAIHTGRHLNLEFNHPLCVKRGIILSLHNRACTIYRERQDRFKEIDNL
jgi:hypothetical protein